MSYKIMIVDDDHDILNIVKLFVTDAGYQALTFDNGPDALEMLDDEISLILLDVSMPLMSGFEFCKIVRTKSKVPILFLTARSQSSDLMTGLNLGGDDYIVKPFSRNELLARIKANLRRYYNYNETQIIHEKTLNIHGLEINTEFNTAMFQGTKISLSDKEFGILSLLATHAGVVYSIPEIYEHVWNEKYLHDSANTVMVHIRKLRSKLEETTHLSNVVRNVWGKGYVIDA